MRALRKAAEARFFVCGSTCGRLRKHGRKHAEGYTYVPPYPLGLPQPLCASRQPQFISKERRGA